jgi:hypothetical protein
MANRRTDAEIVTAAMDWFESHDPVRDWHNIFERDRTETVCRACILGAVFMVTGGGKTPHAVCDAIYSARRELFPKRTLSQHFTKAEIQRLYRHTIEIIASRKPRARFVQAEG